MLLFVCTADVPCISRPHAREEPFSCPRITCRQGKVFLQDFTILALFTQAGRRDEPGKVPKID